jgi:hypothetical protein
LLMSKQNPIRAHTATNFRYFSDRLLAVERVFRHMNGRRGLVPEDGPQKA